MGSHNSTDVMPSHHYTEHQKRHALAVLAYNGSNYKATADQLKADPNSPSITRETLGRWVRSDPDLYAEVYETELPAIRRKHAAATDNIIASSMALAQKAIDRTDKELPSLPAREVPGALRNILVGFGIAVDKSAVMRGEPNIITSRKIDTTELATELARLNPEMAKALGVLVEVDEEDVTDAELVAPPQLDEGERKT